MKLMQWAVMGLLIFVVGCAADRYSRSTGQYIDDKGITARAKAALFDDPLVSGFDVDVTTYRGVVSLSGFVNTPAVKARAAEIVAGIEGVQEVENNLTIKPLPVGAGVGPERGTGVAEPEELREPVTPEPEIREVP